MSSFQDFDRDPIPLKPKGKKPKFIKPADKHNANEGQYKGRGAPAGFDNVHANPVGPPPDLL